MNNSNATTAAFDGAATLLPADNFPEIELLSGHKQLQVLQLSTEFNLSDCSGGYAVGTRWIGTNHGPLGTLKVRLGCHQVWVLLNLSDREVVAAIVGWRQAGFLPLCSYVDGEDTLIAINVHATFGAEALDMGKRQPLAADVFARLAMTLAASGAVATQATSEHPFIPALSRTSTSILATSKVRLH